MQDASLGQKRSWGEVDRDINSDSSLRDPRFAQAYLDCPWNGKSVGLAKKRQISHHYGEALRYSEGEEDNRYEVSDVPAPPSAETQRRSITLFLQLTMGPEMAIDSLETDLWVKHLADAVSCTPWDNVNSLNSNALLNLAQRCLRAEMVNIGMAFVKMVNEMLFAAKINRYIWETGS